MANAEKSLIINAVDRTLDVIEYLFRADGDVSITQISKDLGIYKSTVYRTLVTLQNRGYVRQNRDNGKYSLGIKTYILGSKMTDIEGIGEIVKPYMERLSDTFHEAVNVSVLDVAADGTYNSIIIAKRSSYHTLNANTILGSSNLGYCSAVGKCLLAFSQDVDLSVYESHPMEKFTENTITNIDDLRAELQKIRRNRYAIDNEEREIDLFCVGTPILKGDWAVAAISLSGSAQRMKQHGLSQIIEQVKETGVQISNALQMR